MNKSHTKKGPGRDPWRTANPTGTKLSKSLNRDGYGFTQYLVSKKRKNRKKAA